MLRPPPLARFSDRKIDLMESGDTAITAQLVLCVPAGWDTYLSREFHEIHQNLAALEWNVMVVGEVEDDCVLESMRRARVVLLWECYEFL
jgi:hypothetical protein